ncbi:unnamed protein product [Phytophthora lilii]|uniref:Unnamed protein product n=1 Tax=Phytophthora lilii TaxID=2077276 RepID=A0A9W6XG65_9STRA|nr:unnamed protein product [Phytophthora lilii]
MYRELTISSDVPAPKLTKAPKTDLILPGMRSRKVLSEPKEDPFGVKSNLGNRQRSNSLRIVVCSARGWMPPYQLLRQRLEPQAAIPARAANKSLTGVALSYAKRKGVLTDAVDAGEKYLLSKATKPEHETLIKSMRGEVKRRYGVGVSKKPAKGSPEMKAKMATLRAKRKKPMQAGSFRL